LWLQEFCGRAHCRACRCSGTRFPHAAAFGILGIRWISPSWMATKGDGIAPGKLTGQLGTTPRWSSAIRSVCLRASSKRRCALTSVSALVPDPADFPQLHQYVRPYIFTDAQIGQRRSWDAERPAGAAPSGCLPAGYRVALHDGPAPRRTVAAARRGLRFRAGHPLHSAFQVSTKRGSCRWQTTALLRVNTISLLVVRIVRTYRLQKRPSSGTAAKTCAPMPVRRSSSSSGAG
jgi:hypothetical protein